jgi:hypothetical protein
MKKIFVYALPVAISLSAIGISLNSHATAAQAPKLQSAITTAVQQTGDLDLVGVVGDVLIDGCKSGEPSCSKAWKDLDGLAAQSSL